MKTVLIGAAGSHAADIRTVWNRRHHDSLLYSYDDKFQPPNSISQEEAAALHAILGVNQPRLRMELAKRFPLMARPLIDPHADVGPTCELERGTVVASYALLLRDVILGCHTHVNFGAMMTRCTIGDFVTIAPGVTICGDTTIGSGTFIGAGATITNLLTIGENVVIGAGAVVIRNVPDGATVKGVPAR